MTRSLNIMNDHLGGLLNSFWTDAFVMRIELSTLAGLVSFGVSSVKGVTGIFWLACCCVILTTPYRISCIAAVFCDMNSLEGRLVYSTPFGVVTYLV